jgi:hypothetical protein
MKRTIALVLVLALGLAAEVVNADFTFGTPTNMGPIVNSSARDQGPSISGDGLELYFSSTRSGSAGRYDLWVATRPTASDPWGEPVNLGPTVNSSDPEWAPSISADGLSLYFNSPRPGGYGGSWGDIWVTTRATKDDAWASPVNLGSTVNSSYQDITPGISADELELFFTSNRPGGLGNQDMWVSRRGTKDDPWDTSVNLGPIVNSSANEHDASISADGRMLFSGDYQTGPFRTGGYGAGDMWIMTRATVSDPWSIPVNLGPTINSSAFDGHPVVSADGSTIFFMSDRPGGLGDHDLWQAPILPVIDFNGDGMVDSADMCIIVDYWGTDEPLCDIGPMPWGDGVVDVQDLIVLAEHLFEEPGLIAHWKLDETEGILAHDSAGENDAYVIGGPLWQSTGGMVDGALQFDGVDDYVITGPALDPAEGPFSVLAWIKGGAPGQVVLSQTGGVNWLCTDSSEGNLMTELKDTGRNATELMSQTIITDGDWHRIALVWDGSHRTLYVDDIAVAEDAQTNLEASENSLYIGTGMAMEPGTFWSGLIDDVRIYNRAVTP